MHSVWACLGGLGFSDKLKNEGCVSGAGFDHEMVEHEIGKADRIKNTGSGGTRVK
jgi:hypothetical protein